MVTAKLQRLVPNLRRTARTVYCKLLQASQLGPSGPRILLPDNRIESTFAGESIDVDLQKWPESVPDSAHVLQDRLTDELSIPDVTHVEALLDIRAAGYSFNNLQAFDSSRRFITTVQSRWTDLPIARKRFEPTESFTGAVAFLTNDVHNYYHWMCWAVPLYDIYNRHGLLEQIDAFYTGPIVDGSFRDQTLDRLGVTKDQRIQTAVRADRLIFAQAMTDPPGDFVMPKKHYKFVRSLYQSSLSKGPFRRLYVRRGNVKRRKVLGEDALIEGLLQLGFEICSMDGLSVEEQARLFSEAQVIVAPHGAALTNLIFASPLCKVIEIHPESYVKTYFYAIATYAGAKYAYYVAPAANPGSGTETDLDLDAHDFLNRLEGWLAN